MTVARKRALFITLCAAVVIAVTATVMSATTSRRRSESRQPLGRPHIRNAKPLWSGDTFKVVRTNDSLPPYAYSSASGPSGGWNQAHSNTDPNAEGVVVVRDPLGLASTTDPTHSVREVLKLTTDRNFSFDGYVRAQLRSPPMLAAGEDRWVIAEVFIPRDTPVMPGAPRTFWTILSIFGPPYSGSGPDSFSLKRNKAGTGNDLTWDLPDGDSLWRTPATPGVWHIIARHIFLDSDPKKGYSEVWYSKRGPAGAPHTPLTRQLIGGVDGIPLSHRRYYATLDPAHNWDGTPNTVNLDNYHTADMWPDHRYTTLYFARHRVYDGRTPVRQIDPYFTGLR